MKTIVITIAILFAVSCEKASTRKFTVAKSDDNNWTTTAMVECDSCSMTDINTVVLWIDGNKMTIKGQIIKIKSN